MTLRFIESFSSAVHQLNLLLLLLHNYLIFEPFHFSLSHFVYVKYLEEKKLMLPCNGTVAGFSFEYSHHSIIGFGQQWM